MQDLWNLQSLRRSASIKFDAPDCVYKGTHSNCVLSEDTALQGKLFIVQATLHKTVEDPMEVMTI